MRRFFKAVEVRQCADGFEIALDDKPMRTPARVPLAVPTRPLADAIAEEWRSQGDALDLGNMRLTKLANTAIDRIAPDPGPVIEEMVGYVETDLVCYRADSPEELVTAQTESWTPILDWLEERHGVRLETTVGVVPRRQSPNVVQAVREILTEEGPMTLAAFHSATTVAGSIVLAIALNDGRVDGEQAFALSQLDEDHQIAQWGEDAEAAARREALRVEMLAAERFLRLGRG